MSCMAMGGFAIADASVPKGRSRAKAKAAAERYESRGDGPGPTSAIFLLDDLAWRQGREKELCPPLESVNSGRED